MRKSKMSRNFKVLREIISKTRQLSISPDISYMTIYTFLYKYCSDMLRDYFMTIIEDKPITLDEAYSDMRFKELFRDDALNIFGYFIKDSSCFFDEVINDKYMDDFFLCNFFEAFVKNVEFQKGSNYERYFSFIFDAVKDTVNFNKYEFEGENHIIVKEIIYLISKLDTFDAEFPFASVFDRISESKLIQVDSDPDYITSLLISLIKSDKDHIDNFYNPFLNDASSILKLSEYEIASKNTFAKSQDKITYTSNIVKFLINDYPLDFMYLEFASPFESVGVSSTSFDTITARIPPITNKNIHRLNKAQRREIAKRNKRKELENLLSDKFNIDEDSFANDKELNTTLESLLEKMDLDDPKVEFSGEYESLKDSEYLFLINLIKCLNDDGIMAVSLSQGFLTKNTLGLLRKYLTYEKNCIDAVISIPNELSRPNPSEIIVVFKKHRIHDDILFVDMSSDYKAVSSKYSVPGLFKRNLTLHPDSINKVVEVYTKRESIDKFSQSVAISEIADNEYNLSVSRYVDTFEGEFVKLEDLRNEKREITQNIKILNKKIDMMMDELNIRF